MPPAGGGTAHPIPTQFDPFQLGAAVCVYPVGHDGGA
ncbi:hypothetical protein GGD68_005262 [Paraburkholderia fungorum]|jgi:hypothetical protein|uniref:Uncharacterized protein n=1 Tax=Paraburkholderia fungorum TaxID=134537 RepID=A0AAW3V3I8_9BURK|nr:hypothetical protein [Paraburkholderia fungorum]MBB5545280.1 hypothetical protein [Paraburkholderia fungorum]MBB6205064.1 hypothetical protein [Paraburkholderia fungorum]